MLLGGVGVHTPTVVSVGIVASVLVGCATSPDAEDGVDDTFTSDGKADGFGVEDWSPDGAAVLRLASTASASKLHDDVGLSQKVADAIVSKRATLHGGQFEDLADLDAVTYVGTTVFDRMLTHVTDHHLFKTSLRLPS